MVILPPLAVRLVTALAAIIARVVAMVISMVVGGVACVAMRVHDLSCLYLSLCVCGFDL